MCKSILQFTIMKYTQIYELKFIRTWAHRLYMVPYTVERNVNKCQDAVCMYNIQNIY